MESAFFLVVKKAEVYKWITIGGLLSFVPFILASGPLAGYFLGSYLERKFGLPYYVSLILMGAGLAASVVETVKVVKRAYRTS